MSKYDSTFDTSEHIQKVRDLLYQVMFALTGRAKFHDESKFKDPEKKIFDEFTPKLKKSTYGSGEYKQFLNDMGKALKHHYANNAHHPEHFSNGIDGMSLIDLIEMLADWKAATLRHENGDIKKSLLINKDRFGISDQLFNILENTIIGMNWDEYIIGNVLPEP